MNDLNAMVNRLATETLALAGLNQAAAVAEADHKRLRAKCAVKHRAAGQSAADVAMARGYGGGA